MGVAALGLPTPDLESARFHLERAKAMLDDLLKQFEENGAVEVVFSILLIFNFCASIYSGPFIYYVGVSICRSISSNRGTFKNSC